MYVCVYIFEMHELGVADGDFFKGLVSALFITRCWINGCHHSDYIFLSLSLQHANWLVHYRRGGFAVFDFTSSPHNEQQSCGADE